MKFTIRTTRRRNRAFTLAELLASLLFLAIVIPAAIYALRVASLAGSVSARKGAAARIADRLLSESMVMTNWSGSRGGTVSEEGSDFRWNITRANWTGAPVQDIQQLTAEVTFSAQGHDYSVRLTTLGDVVDLNPGSSSSRNYVSR